MATSEEKLGTMPVGRLILSMSVPMMLSFFIQALYNLVDSMFVARLSEDALTAVSLAFPMQQLMHAISVGLGVGVNASLPRFLGRNDRKKAEEAVGTAAFWNLVFFVIFALMGLFLVRPIYLAQTSVQTIVDGGTTYLTICWVVSIGEFFGQFFEKLLLATGRSFAAMASQAAGAVFNIIFDPLLIFGIGPFPALGIAGAAIATVLGQILAACIAALLSRRKGAPAGLHLRNIRFRKDASRDIFSVGVPSMITIGLSSAMSFSINQILLVYSTTATAVFGIWMKLQNFCFMPVFGMNNGMVPILSYNYAKGNRERVERAIRLAVRGILIYLVALSAVLFGIPDRILLLFSASENMLSIGVHALRVLVLSLPFGGTCVLLTTTMQSMQHARYALVLNILRQFVFPVPLFAALSALTGDLYFVWAAVPMAEILSLCVCVILERRMQKRLWSST